jgi:uncharacterized membrane protein YedE/YeeE
MTLDWAHFTPWTALAGGLLIGAAAGALVLFAGRIAGVAGVVGGLLRPERGDIAWRLAFVAGLVASAMLYPLFAPLPEIRIDAGIGTVAVAGLIVGLSTRYASGCTSGHGVCGVARASPRSLVATAAFMLSGFLTVYVARHVLGG